MTGPLKGSCPVMGIMNRLTSSQKSVTVTTDHCITIKVLWVFLNKETLQLTMGNTS